jgi:hypothetical protein
MSRKSPTSPRRIYLRKGIVHVCFNGKYYGVGQDSTEISLDHPVFLEQLPAYGGYNRVQVTQKRRGVARRVETWRTVNIGPVPSSEEEEVTPETMREAAAS